MRACHGEGAEVSPLGANDYIAFGNVWVGMNVFPLKVFVRGQMSTSNKPAKIGGIIGLIWGLLMVLVTRTIYIDGEYGGEGYMAANTALVLVGSLSMISGAFALNNKHRSASTTLLLVAMLAFLFGIVPGLAFSYIGFPGFGSKYFVITILAPAVVLTLFPCLALRKHLRDHRG